MIEVGEVPIFLRPGATDGRKAIDGLVGIIQGQMKMDVLQGGLFIFCSKAKTSIKYIIWDECLGYIDHHLKVIGGCSSDIFEKPALVAIGQVSAGIPRNINTVCLLALAHGMEQGTTTISADVIRKVARNWWD